jgi:hypothetical protein
MTMKYKEFKINAPTDRWSFLVWFLKTKECHYILIGLFLLLILLMFTSPETVMKLKIAFWNLILNKMK